MSYCTLPGVCLIDFEGFVRDKNGKIILGKDGMPISPCLLCSGPPKGKLRSKFCTVVHCKALSTFNDSRDQTLYLGSPNNPGTINEVGRSWVTGSRSLKSHHI